AIAPPPPPLSSGGSFPLPPTPSAPRRLESTSAARPASRRRAPRSSGWSPDGTASAGAEASTDMRRDLEVLHRHTGQIRDRDLLLAAASAAGRGDELAQLDHAARIEEPGLDGVGQLAVVHTLGEAVRDHD